MPGETIRRIDVKPEYAYPDEAYFELDRGRGDSRVHINCCINEADGVQLMFHAPLTSREAFTLGTALLDFALNNKLDPAPDPRQFPRTIRQPLATPGHVLVCRRTDERDAKTGEPLYEIDRVERPDVG